MVWTYLIPATPVFELIQQKLLYPPNTLQLFKNEQKLIQNHDSSSKSAKRIAIQCDQKLIRGWCVNWELLQARQF